LKISFDPAKNERNVAERGLSFELASELDWSTSWIIEDLRRDYGERRFQVVGFIAGRLYALVFTPRADSIHVISLRKANRREIRRYEAQNQADSPQ